MNDGEIILGIDLGTTFSLVAYADEKGIHVIRDSNGDGRVPSVIGFGPDRKVAVGWQARRHAVEDPRHTVYSIKRLIGLGLDDIERELPYLSYRVVRGDRETVVIDIDGRMLTPQEISSLILRELRERAESHFGRPMRKAVITAPAYFDDSQRQATRDAGRLAGLEVVRIINEPTAAALAYGIGLERRTKTGTGALTLAVGHKSRCTSPVDAASSGGADDLVVVFDLGGGTFDVSILRFDADVYQVLSTHGDTHLGGDDFDRQIIDLVTREVVEQFGVQIEDASTRQALRLFAEEVKIQLSEKASATLELDLEHGRVYRRSLSREEFEGLISPWLDRTLAACRQALKDARLAPGDIGQVVLVGGSTRIPLVRRRVAEFFGRTPYTALNPDEVVALGAAVQGQVLSGSRSDALLLDVTPLSLGIETLGGAMGKLIMRNTRIPCSATEHFTTFIDGQTSVKINVLQGERELAADCRQLASFDLRGIPPMPAGIPKVAVQFLIDANGILNVFAREERSGAEANVQVLPAHGLTREEVARIERESILHAREDMAAHRLVDLRNQVEFDTHKAEQTLAKFGQLLEHSEREALEAAMRELRALAKSSSDADLLHRQLDRFGEMTERLANLAITETLREQTAQTARG